MPVSRRLGTGLSARAVIAVMGLLGLLALAALPVLAAAYPAVLRVPRRDPTLVVPVRAQFSHRQHGAFKCYACHPSLFPQGALTFGHDDMKQGRFCAACHDGRTGFAITESPCERCHAR